MSSYKVAFDYKLAIILHCINTNSGLVKPPLNLVVAVVEGGGEGGCGDGGIRGCNFLSTL